MKNRKIYKLINDMFTHIVTLLIIIFGFLQKKEMYEINKYYFIILFIIFTFCIFSRKQLKKART